MTSKSKRSAHFGWCFPAFQRGGTLVWATIPYSLAYQHFLLYCIFPRLATHVFRVWSEIGGYPLFSLSHLASCSQWPRLQSSFPIIVHLQGPLVRDTSLDRHFPFFTFPMFWFQGTIIRGVVRVAEYPLSIWQSYMLVLYFKKVGGAMEDTGKYRGYHTSFSLLSWTWMFETVSSLLVSRFNHFFTFLFVLQSRGSVSFVAIYPLYFVSQTLSPHIRVVIV